MTPVLPVLSHQVTNHHLPAWARIWVWAMANANEHGHARAYPGELRAVLDADSTEVSRAIRYARKRRLLDQSSNAGCLVLPGCALAPCPAIHRGDV